MQVILFYLLTALGVIAFSFVFWLRLREDYTPDQIFSSTLLVFLGGVLGFIIFDRWLPSFVFWGFLAGAVLFGLYASKKIDLKFYEAGDAFSLGLGWFSLFFYLAVLFKEGFGEKFLRILEVLPPLVVILAFYLILKNYRRFSWYPSGKIGFILGSIGAIYFFIRALVAIYQYLMLSFSSSIWDIPISLLLSGFFAGLVFVRSGKSLPVFSGRRKK